MQVCNFSEIQVKSKISECVLCQSSPHVRSTPFNLNLLESFFNLELPLRMQFQYLQQSQIYLQRQKLTSRWALSPA